MSKKILIADDDAQVVSALSRALANYDLEEAGDGKTALSLAFSAHPDLIILDIDMPAMNGIEVLEKLAKMKDRPLTIMLTGSGDPETVSKAMALGVFAYIIKPFEMEEIQEQVKRAFSFMESKKAA